VIEQEAGIAEYDSRDRPFIWSLTGGEQRFATGLVDRFVTTMRRSATSWPPPIGTRGRTRSERCRYLQRRAYAATAGDQPTRPRYAASMESVNERNHEPQTPGAAGLAGRAERQRCHAVRLSASVQVADVELGDVPRLIAVVPTGPVSARPPRRSGTAGRLVAGARRA
jgi:hypothetical protein